MVYDRLKETRRMEKMILNQINEAMLNQLSPGNPHIQRHALDELYGNPHFEKRLNEKCTEIAELIKERVEEWNKG